MSKQKPDAPAPSGERSLKAELESTQNLGKIRDILFGNQARDFDQRLSSIEERLRGELEALREDTAKRLQSLETFVKRELDGQVDKIRSQNDARLEQHKKLRTELGDLSDDVNRRLEQGAEKLERAQRELREELLSNANSLRDEQQAQSKRLNASLNEQTGQLGESKLSKTDLAAMLSDLAHTLSGEAEGA